jgi:dTMP kinase
MKKGRLITFEGGEGAGKTTQVALLEKCLRRQGLVVTVAREPGSTKIAEQIRRVVLNPENSKMSDLTEALLYQAARAQVYHEVVCPALARGEVVLMDRSSDSSLVYQGMVRGWGVKNIEELNRIATGGTLPDLTLLLDVPVVTGFRRIETEKLDRLEQAGRKFHQAVREGYLRLAARRGYGRIKIIDGTKSVEKVQAQVNQLVMAELGLELEN